jgi:hypothetical protein
MVENQHIALGYLSYYLYLKYMIHNNFQGFFEGFLPDVRLVQRTEKVMNDMLKFGNVVVNKFCCTPTDKIGAYRMLGNDTFSDKDLIKGLQQACKDNQGAEHLLCIQDTTELNYTAHLERIGKQDPDIGPVTRDDNAGFFCHPMLVLDPQKMIPMGVCAVKLWNRSWNGLNRHQRNYKKQDISEKESFRWIESAQEAKKVLTETPLKTIIGDRESDIYEEIVSIPDAKTHLLIRSSWNRNLYDSQEKLFDFLASREQKATYDFEVKGNKKRESRIAKMSLRYTKVKLQKPINRDLNKYPDYVEVWAIEAKEISQSVPGDEDPIHWRLLTTHQLNDIQDAINCIDWYKARWHIEELFRVLKSKGLQIESSQLETGAALKKLTVLAIQVALTTMTLKLSLKKPDKTKAGIVFSNEQIDFITILLKKLEGKTEKQKNPHTPKTLPWAAWAIARLSGWSGYTSQGPPGYISIKNGLDIFNNNYMGYEMAKNLFN